MEYRAITLSNGVSYGNNRSSRELTMLFTLGMSGNWVSVETVRVEHDCIMSQPSSWSGIMFSGDWSLLFVEVCVDVFVS